MIPKWVKKFFEKTGGIVPKDKKDLIWLEQDKDKFFLVQYRQEENQIDTITTASNLNSLEVFFVKKLLDDEIKRRKEQENVVVRKSL